MIETERLVLRGLVLGDEAQVQAYAGDPRVCQHMEWGPNTPDDTRKFLMGAIESAKEMPRRFYEFAITLRSTGALIGSAGIRIRSVLHRSGDLGYALHPDAWGKGYGTEAANALLQFGKKDLGLHRVWATCRPENVASARILEKIGMTLEGRMREEKHIRGKWVDSLLYASVGSSAGDGMT